MHVIRARNVQTALPKALDHLSRMGVRRESRNGAVTKFPTPVTTVYEKPTERVIFHAKRDANPYFHFFESLWMLSGRQDVKWLAQFNSKIAEYSDNGETFHAAYGYRWRKHFKVEIPEVGFASLDQLALVIELLRENKDDRRVVLTMWSPEADLGRLGKDFPCNLQAIFSVTEEGSLDMMVTNRSNDIVWGCYGANAVHFSYLLEYIAAGVGVPVGRYYQVSNNLHMYDFNSHLVEGVTLNCEDPYFSGRAKSFPLVNTDIKTWEMDLTLFFERGPITGFRDEFFTKVVTPLWWSYVAFKKRDDPNRFDNAREIVEQCADTGWALAAKEWLNRREENAKAGK